MATTNKHRAWLVFLRKALDVPVDYSVDQLRAFRDIAARENPSVVPLIEDYLRLAKRSETGAPYRSGGMPRTRHAQMHLFDLLREKRFFPRNSDLARFASRVLPEMRSYTFDKMARSDIAARIIEHIENSDPRTRTALESSMRQALDSLMVGVVKKVDKSFLSKWENIIKGLEL